MELLVKTYSVKVVRESGDDPLTGQCIKCDEQSFEVDATSVKAAYSLSHLVCTLRFSGQLRRTFIDGQEYFNECY